jgi:hypothetical protein
MGAVMGLERPPLALTGCYSIVHSFFTKEHAQGSAWIWQARLQLL